MMPGLSDTQYDFMTKQRNIFVIGGSTDYANWCSATIVHDMKEADLVMLTGGADVNPALYGAKRHPTTFFDDARDRYEVAEFKRAKGLGLPVIGICRGSQLACVMAGGQLIQNMSHPSEHVVMDRDKHCFTVTSSHHQAQYPWFLPADEFKVLWWSNGLSPHHEGGDMKEMVNGQIGLMEKPIPNYSTETKNLPEVEACYYPAINTLGIQSHPEWAHPPDGEAQREYIYRCRELLDYLLKGTL